ncbi:hypothetical protein DPMN_066361 [Dreissena polymorpha]|uniref:Uncharacterized protein n=1 Tax=Dreissena polymorpha TaxID=45954 RepID=A0A9D4BRZ9_DREPO|nr:hypothetical protein DPMN_066341 [Dreissena polymorpha]KAH3706970.1 hypothetical protein DPMN_066361 [Dreissena polymorpha]
MPSDFVTVISGSGIPVGSVYGPIFSGFRFADPQLHDRKKSINTAFVEVSQDTAITQL